MTQRRSPPFRECGLNWTQSPQSPSIVFEMLSMTLPPWRRPPWFAWRSLAWASLDEGDGGEMFRGSASSAWTPPCQRAVSLGAMEGLPENQKSKSASSSTGNRWDVLGPSWGYFRHGGRFSARADWLSCNRRYFCACFGILLSAV